ncbi:L-cystine transport system permease protein tcyL [Sebaldella termitidis]|jgi:polar amino acid transport system permease protein|uniref:Polar amino acid ABC transporter, inner membrane subunit n=1 Tax=Sebaldella termitidis (strain ATCC 33386 / NCTC 11300) TaxID=526218 RepID=D1AI16_SEBTE|nr:amino acid ABC transporter permease [Sebaldella termitidis]ACZ08400.1 polar amino acid ABC transporter, inner membrane subunit [Sebaldella termitidis ATCC 33386]SUI23713.1 L-cystine transport system permease protein tcyL [Sebaldella termitidis]
MINLDYGSLAQIFSALLEGLWVTLRIALLSIIFSVIFGIILGIIMNSKNILVRVITRIYLEFFRIIPVIVWLFIVFFWIPMGTGLNITGEGAAVLVFSMWGSAEMGDLVRGAIESLPKIQSESAKSIGLNKIQIYYYVLIPQALKRVIPSAINLSTRVIKTTSLVVLIGVVDVVKKGQQIIERTKSAFFIYALLFLIYFIICYPLSYYSRKLEKSREK